VLNSAEVQIQRVGTVGRDDRQLVDVHVNRQIDARAEIKQSVDPGGRIITGICMSERHRVPARVRTVDDNQRVRAAFVIAVFHSSRYERAVRRRDDDLTKNQIDSICAVACGVGTEDFELVIPCSTEDRQVNRSRQRANVDPVVSRVCTDEFRPGRDSDTGVVAIKSKGRDGYTSGRIRGVKSDQVNDLRTRSPVDLDVVKTAEIGRFETVIADQSVFPNRSTRIAERQFVRCWRIRRIQSQIAACPREGDRSEIGE